MINYIFYKKSIILNKENNTKQIFINIATKSYINIFIRYEIIFSKKFKQNILNKPLFDDYFYLFAINKIYLMEK